MREPAVYRTRQLCIETQTEARGIWRSNCEVWTVCLVLLACWSQALLSYKSRQLVTLSVCVNYSWSCFPSLKDSILKLSPEEAKNLRLILQLCIRRHRVHYKADLSSMVSPVRRARDSNHTGILC
ncbi:hypothetical protein O3P69_014714 [Scylla paramamosain]|uniref:Uncharacterized protein n=1 Tax=Scylla paramamosain TaxID=85552 RepID=A0AAW0TXQ6_SCYPA